MWFNDPLVNCLTLWRFFFVFADNSQNLWFSVIDCVFLYFAENNQEIWMSVFQLVFSYLEATVVGLLEAARCQSSSGGGEAFKWGRGRRFLLNCREITWNLIILCYRNTEKYNNVFTWYWLLKVSGTEERPSIKWGQTTEWCLANTIG